MVRIDVLPDLFPRSKLSLLCVYVFGYDFTYLSIFHV